MKLACVFVLVVLAIIDPTSALAQDSPKQVTKAGDGRATGDELDPTTKCAIGRLRSCDISEAVGRGLFETGLKPSFPEHAQCREIDEGYAIPYASKRDREPYHGGIDMPAPFGTPMIAAAAGTVVAKYEGERSFRGMEVVLRHSPEDTGLPLWIYTQYAHCSELPALEIGQRVRMGETICPTGNSGITQPGKRRARRPAIHFGVFYSSDERYAEFRERIIPFDGHWMDPVALFRNTTPLDSAAMKALPEAEKQVAIAVMFENGETFPANTKLVWPYTCTRR